MFRQGKVKLVKGAFGKNRQNDAKCKLNLGPYLGQLVNHFQFSQIGH
jgi:hypothetical protein